ncbi:unnamed protein product [Ceratitis capitata]|uniref:(Mediterranean fruit fly) hypothetical protein n=1 Tax=Ceratitis capitata TaxID=7213 RepID=A0A811UTH2_CERCA|nr:unnamed protein product [Ceratitis capitata]
MPADESAKWFKYTSQVQQAINAHKHSSMKFSQFESFMVTQKNRLCFEQVILTAQENLDTTTDKFDKVTYSIVSNAKRVVSSLLIHPENKPVVMEELEFNFGRPELPINEQMQIIQDFPSRTSSAVIDGCRRMHNPLLHHSSFTTPSSSHQIAKTNIC